MSDKPDVAALTDEQADDLVGPIIGTCFGMEFYRALVRAGRASLQVRAETAEARVAELEREQDAAAYIMEWMVAEKYRKPDAPTWMETARSRVRKTESENAALRADAERWRELPAWLEKYQIDYIGLLRDIDAARAKSNVPYPEFCRHPDKCAGRGTCPRDPCCCD
jgi:hypothetical protein